MRTKNRRRHIYTLYIGMVFLATQVTRSHSRKEATAFVESELFLPEKFWKYVRFV